MPPRVGVATSYPLPLPGGGRGNVPVARNPLIREDLWLVGSWLVVGYANATADATERVPPDLAYNFIQPALFLLPLLGVLESWRTGGFF